jgi:hypothetical protein
VLEGLPELQVMLERMVATLYFLQLPQQVVAVVVVLSAEHQLQPQMVKQVVLEVVLLYTMSELVGLPQLLETEPLIKVSMAVQQMQERTLAVAVVEQVRQAILTEHRKVAMV